VESRGWDAVDIVFVTGDAYVDHPAFAMAILARVLEADGFRVALLSQPPWRSADAFRRFGRPRICFAVSAGNMDSMINHYTANRKPRSDDAYSPGGHAGLRPDRATNVYVQRCREAFRGVPVIAGGVEPSLRRFAHYDYWSDKVLPSMLVTSKADLVVHGMGEGTIVKIARALRAGADLVSLRGLRSVAYLSGGKESPPVGATLLPSFDQVANDPLAFSRATRTIHRETNPYNARPLAQRHGDRWVVVQPAELPLDTAALDAIYALPYTRRPHPAYRERIPAFETVRYSVTLMRGCFGGCTFCSITNHQGRIVQSRSAASVREEIARMQEDPAFTGVISDLGGPTANMYHMRCTRPEVEAICRRLSCVHPTICKLMNTSHEPVKALLREVRETPGIKKALVASGVRVDLAVRDPEYVRALARHHTGGRAKVAPEHACDRVLDLMKKPAVAEFERFTSIFSAESRRAGKEQEIIPYFISSHPGSDVDAMIELALFLHRTGYRPLQVQDFIPAPMDIATSMYHTGLDPFSLKPVPVAKRLRERKMQRALMQFFVPENWFAVRKILVRAGRSDLIGSHPQALIPEQPPHAAIVARRLAAGRSPRLSSATGLDGDHRDDAEQRPRSTGYRPHRKGWRASTGARRARAAGDGDSAARRPTPDAREERSAEPHSPARRRGRRSGGAAPGSAAGESRPSAGKHPGRRPGKGPDVKAGKRRRNRRGHR
jgi:uncharacterized radical SAM protein YgiQ